MGTVPVTDSGLKANLNKTVALWSVKRPKRKIQGFKFDMIWVVQFKLLGIFY